MKIKKLLMLLLFLSFISSESQASIDDFNELAYICNKYRFHLYKNKTLDSKIVSLILRSLTIDEIFDDINRSSLSFVFGLSSISEYILSDHPINGKQLISLEKPSEFFLSFHYCLCVLYILTVLFSLIYTLNIILKLRFFHKVYRIFKLADHFILFNNKKIIFGSLSVEIDFDKYIFLDKEVQYLCINFDYKESKMYSVILIPLFLNIKYGVFFTWNFTDFVFNNQTLIDHAMYFNNNKNEFEEVPLFINSDKTYTVKTSDGDINISPNTHFYIPPCIFEYGYTFSISIASLFKFITSPDINLKMFEQALELLFLRIGYSGLAFFIETPIFKEQIKMYTTDPELESILSDSTNSIEVTKLGELPNLINVGKYTVVGYKYMFRNTSYYIVTAIENHKPLFIGNESFLSVEYAIVSIIFHINIYNIGSSKILDRIDDFMKKSRRMTFYEFRGKSSGNLKNDCSVSVSGYEHTNKTAIDRSISKMCSKNVEEDIVVLDNASKIINIHFKKFSYDIVNSHFTTVFVEDVTSISSNKASPSGISYDDAVKLLGFHRVLDETNILSPSLVNELGYSNPAQGLNELRISKDTIKFEYPITNFYLFRLKNSDGASVWYSSLVLPYGMTNNKYILNIDNITRKQNIYTQKISDSLLITLNNNFVFYSIDSTTKDIIFRIGHYMFEFGNFYDVCNRIHRDKMSDFMLAFDTFMSSNLKQFKQRVPICIENRYIVYDITITKINDCTINATLLNVDNFNDSCNLLSEINSDISLAFSNSKIIQWSFVDSESHSLPNIILNSNEPIVINESSLQRSLKKGEFEKLNNTFRECMRTGKPFEVTVSIFLDIERHLVFRGFRSENKNELYGIYFDCTNAKNKENELWGKIDSFLDSNFIKTMNIAKLTHEARASSSCMFSIIELLLNTNLLGEEKTSLMRSQNLFFDLLELLNNVLDLEKIEQRKMNCSSSLFSPISVVEQVYQKFYHKVDRSKIFIDLVCEPSTPLIYNGDSYILKRCIENILSNAYKYTIKGSIIIYINSNERENFVISVTDTGCGISDEKQSYIRNLGTKNLSFLEDHTYGLGIKLIVSLLNLVQGELYFRSKLNSGSTFTLVFPYDPAYYPYIPRKLRESGRSVIDLTGRILDTNIRKYMKFYGISEITEEQIDDKTLFILTNDDKTVALARELKKKAPSAFLLFQCSNAMQPQPSDFGRIETPHFPSRARSQILNGFFFHTYAQQKKKTSDISVLAADDNPTNRSILEKILLCLGYKFEIVSNGYEVLLRLAKRNFDILLIGQDMPILDGLTCTRTIRQSNADYKNIPIIALIASSSLEDQKLCIESGMNDFVSKPIISYQIQEVISKLVK